MKASAARQLALVHELQAPKRNYRQLYNSYLWGYQQRLCTKHSTHDSIFFIMNLGLLGFQVVKFYNDCVDYRMGGYNSSLAEAYNEAIHVL